MSATGDTTRTDERRVRADVATVVNRVGLEGLIALDCPDDEYDLEIDALTMLVLDGTVSESAVGSIWELSFGPGSAAIRRPDELARLTEQLRTVTVTTSG